MANRMKERYVAEIAPALNKKFGYKSVMQIPKLDKVIVEKVNVATCHTKPRKQGDVGGIVKKETPIRACKVALFCDKCGKGIRVGHKIEGDKKIRVCRKCGAEI